MNGSSKVSWSRVTLFYGLACAISWPFFWWRDMRQESWAAWAAPGFLKTATYMWGPGLASIFILLLFRNSHRRMITVAGGSWAHSLAFYAVPLLLMVGIGIPTEDSDKVSHTYPLLILPIAFFTIFGEELGWRGFLQDELRGLPKWQRYILIGVLWEFWHFTNRTHHGSWETVALRLAIFYPASVLLSWLIGEATERSRSLLVAHTLHLWVDLLLMRFSPRTLVGLAMSAPLWMYLLRTWPKQEAQARR